MFAKSFAAWKEDTSGLFSDVLSIGLQQRAIIQVIKFLCFLLFQKPQACAWRQDFSQYPQPRPQSRTGVGWSGVGACDKLTSSRTQNPLNFSFVFWELEGTQCTGEIQEPRSPTWGLCSKLCGDVVCFLHSLWWAVSVPLLLLESVSE